MVNHVIHFNSGAKRRLGRCGCGKRAPEGRDKDQCVWVGVDTDHHHHVFSGGGLWLAFKMHGFWFIV